MSRRDAHSGGTPPPTSRPGTPPLTPSPCTQGEGRGEGSSPAAAQMHPLPNPLPAYRERERQRARFAGLWTHLLLLNGAILFLFPFAWMILTSFKTDEELSAGNWWPSIPHFRASSSN